MKHRPFSEIRRHPYRPLRGMKRLIFQLRRYWAMRNYRRCPSCDGTGSVVFVIGTDPIYVLACRVCKGTGLIR